jgi:hypothetical protein
MRTLRCLLLPALLALLGARAACAGDRILVPGNPPLTQKMADEYRERWEWYFDVQLSDQQRKQFHRLMISYWQKSNLSHKQGLAKGYARSQEMYTEHLQLKGQEQELNRSQVRSRWLGVLRKDTHPLSRYQIALYENAHKPGGTKNPILVAGEPPLTKALMDQRLLVAEWLLDLRLTPEQDAEYRGLVLKEWKNSDRATRAKLGKVITVWGEWLPRSNAYERNMNRAAVLPRCLLLWSDKDAGADDRWLLALYEAAYKPGGPRNPVLVKGKAPLTQALVDRYGDYVEWALDMAPSGGLSGPQRQVLKEYLAKDWTGMDPAARKDLLGAVKRWSEVMPLPAKERDEWLAALKPKLLAELRVAGDARSQWLLGVHDAARKKELQLAQQQAEQRRLAIYAEQMRHEAVMDALRAAGRSWVYNPTTGLHEWR